MRRRVKVARPAQSGCSDYALRNSGRIVGAGAVLAIFNGVAIFLAAQRNGAFVAAPRAASASAAAAAATPAKAASKPCAQYATTIDADYAGNDLRTVEGVTSMAACCGACTEEASCNAFTYAAAGSACFLKSSGVTTHRVVGYVAATRTRGSSSVGSASPAAAAGAASAVARPMLAKRVAFGAPVSTARNAAEAAAMAALEKPPPPPASATAVELSPEADEHAHGAAFPTGYIRKPRLRLGVPTDARLGSDDGKLHVVFSSGCNYFQHWQAEMVLASAFNVGQRGRITRIVSGCHDVSAEGVAHRHQTFPSGLNDHLVPLALLNRSVNPYFGLYITPTFDGARDFPWINKPSGIHHFLKHAAPEMARLGETVIAILDPDFIFLKPLTQSGDTLSDIIYSQGDRKKWRGMDQVKKGRPVAQRYGIGGGWVHRFPVKAIVGEGPSRSILLFAPILLVAHYSFVCSSEKGRTP